MPRLLSLRSRARELQPLKATRPVLHSKRSHLSERTSSAPQRPSSACLCTWGRARSERRPAQPEISEETSSKKTETKPNEEIHMTRSVCLGPFLPTPFHRRPQNSFHHSLRSSLNYSYSYRAFYIHNFLHYLHIPELLENNFQ